MYKSALNRAAVLEFPFDPLRALHAGEDSQLQWPEYPYKQVMLDRVATKAATPRGGTPPVEAVAGALLAACGNETLALFELEQCRPREDGGDGNGSCDSTRDGGSHHDDRGWQVLEQRFRMERAAFQDGKKQFLKQQKAAVSAILDGIAGRKQAEIEQAAQEAWKQRQIIKRYPDGSKYDGDGVIMNAVLVPHGHGTLWVPEKPLYGSNMVSDMKRVPRYVGEWMDGLKHGRGTYYWTSGDSWSGNFIRDEMYGKGVYTVHSGGSSNGTGTERVRYYDASRHVCWGDELVLGCRLRLLHGRREVAFHAASAVAIPSIGHTEHPRSGGGSEFVIMAFDKSTDRHLLRKDESEDTRWVCLHDKTFQVVSFRPITRLDASIDE